MKILPDTHFLNSIRADRGSRGAYTELVAEAIDNSIDADAHEIAIQLQKEMILLQDNGIGITKDRQDSIVKLGGHGAMPTTMLGRFGIGLKYHAVCAGDSLEVDSYRDGRMKLVANWDRVIQSANGKSEIHHGRPNYLVHRPGRIYLSADCAGKLPR